MSVVIDASAALSWCFADERTAESAKLLKFVSEKGAKVPQIWPLEVGNALLMGERRERISKKDAGKQLENFHQLPIEIDQATANLAWTDIVSLARQHRLTTYDASYIELAIRANLPLATRDKALIATAKKLGIELVQF